MIGRKRKQPFASDNRKIDWDHPLRYKGANYYPIDGAKRVVDGKRSWEEYATGNGAIVRIYFHDGKPGDVTHVVSNRDQHMISMYHKGFHDDVALDFDHRKDSRPDHLGFWDGRKRNWGQVWVNCASYELKNGKWKLTRHEHYLADGPMDDGGVKMERDGIPIRRFEEDYGDYKVITETYSRYEPVEEELERFAKWIPPVNAGDRPYPGRRKADSHILDHAFVYVEPNYDDVTTVNRSGNAKADPFGFTKAIGSKRSPKTYAAVVELDGVTKITPSYTREVLDDYIESTLRPAYPGVRVVEVITDGEAERRRGSYSPDGFGKAKTASKPRKSPSKKPATNKKPASKGTRR